MTGSEVLDRLAEKMVDGNLPILRKTASNIVALASTTRSEIGLIARIILEDQPFTACVLRMANSAYYGRAAKGKVSSVTRAILLLGFSTIRDMAIAAEYADFAQARIPRSIDLERLIAKAFVTARQAVLFARALDLPHAEDLFVRSLFSRLGELTMAYYLPDVYAEIQRQMAAHAQTYEEAHRDIVGIAYLEITKALAQRYGIPGNLVRTSTLPADAAQGTDEDRGDLAIKVAGELSDDLFTAAGKLDAAHMAGLMAKRAAELAMAPSAVTAMVKTAFEQSRSFGSIFGILPAKFELPGQNDPAPRPGQTPPAGREGAVTLKVIDGAAPPQSATAGPLEMAPPPPALETVTPCIGPPESLASASPTDAAPDASMTQADAVPPYLPLLMELSAHVLDRPDFNTVVTYLLEGLHRGCGFAHVALVLPQTATRTLVARFGVGPDTDDRLPAFTSPADPEANFLMRVMAERVPVRMTRREPPTVPLPPALADLGGAHAVALGPLHNATRTVGLIWADHARAIDDATWNAFQLFIMQANIALTRLAK